MTGGAVREVRELHRPSLPAPGSLWRCQPRAEPAPGPAGESRVPELRLKTRESPERRPGAATEGTAPSPRGAPAPPRSSHRSRARPAPNTGTKPPNPTGKPHPRRASSAGRRGNGDLPPGSARSQSRREKATPRLALASSGVGCGSSGRAGHPRPEGTRCEGAGGCSGRCAGGAMASVRSGRVTGTHGRR